MITIAPFSKLVKNLTLTFIPLILIPIIIWLTGWHWEHAQHYQVWDFLLFIVTETGSTPYFALLTSLVLAIALSMRCQRLQHHWVIIFLSVLVLQGATQIVKSAIKYTLEEPRPYMSYIVDQGVEIDTFYDLSRKERAEIITVAVEEDTQTPSWLQQHWQHETGYSFPSGHTIFAVMWAMIIVGFLTRERDSKTGLIGGLITVWAGLMMISRVRLGMHFPIDLFVSTILAYLIALLFFYLLSKRDHAFSAGIEAPDVSEPHYRQKTK